MNRALVVALAVAVLLMFASRDPSPADAKGIYTRVSGGDLPHPVTLASQDAFPFAFPQSSKFPWDQFAGWPELLTGQPEGLGRAYLVESDLWAELNASLVADAGEPRCDLFDCLTATYFPDESVARMNRADYGAPLWVRLDADRARLLNRYIEHTRAGLLPEEPSLIDVLAADRTVAGTLAPVALEGRPLEPTQLARLWGAAASEHWPVVPVAMSRVGAKPVSGNPEASEERMDAMVYGYPDDVRLVITGPDGRQYEVAYYPLPSTLVPQPVSWAYSPSANGIVIPEAAADRFASALGITFATREVSPPLTSERSYTGLLALLVVVAGGAAVAGTLGTLAAGSRPRRTA